MAGDYRRYVGRTVMLQVERVSIGGVLEREVGQTLVLSGASLIEDGQRPVDLDGEVVIERARVLWAQVA